MTDLTPAMLDVHDAAEILDIHPESVRRLIRQGVIKAQKFGPKYFIGEAFMDKFADAYDPRPWRGEIVVDGDGGNAPRILNPHDAVATIDGREIEYTVVAYERDGRWYDGRVHEVPVCDVCDRPANWSDGHSHYCARHDPLPMREVT